jgi:translation elongation factor EF-1alpha
MIASMVKAKDRRKWSQFKDDKDVSQAQREQDLVKIAKEAEKTMFVAPKAWMPKWKKDQMAFELQESEAAAAAAAAALNDKEGPDIAPIARKKPTLSMVVLGPQQSGKTTIVGHLCHRFGSTTKKELLEIEKKAVLKGRGTKKFAWSIDKTKLERDQDTTIQSTRSSFVSKRFTVCCINISSQRKFLKNAIGAISQADCVLFVIPMDNVQFEQAIGPNSIVHDHLYAAFAFGIRQVLVAMNMMDIIKYNQIIYEERQTRIMDYLINIIGFHKSGIDFIPTVATDGDNMFPSELITKSNRKKAKFHPGLLASNENMLWWENIEDGDEIDGGFTLIEKIDNFILPPTKSLTNLPVITYSTKPNVEENVITNLVGSPAVSSKSTPNKGDVNDESESVNESESESESKENQTTEEGEKKEIETSKAIEDVKAKANSSFFKKSITRRGTALRMPISKVYEISGVGTIAVGRIISGSIAQYEKIRIVPGPLDYFGK